jgi:hypothetical protein
VGIRRRMAALIGVGVLAVAGGTLVATQSGAVTSHAGTIYPAGPQGINFTIHPIADTNFCVSDTAVAGLDRPSSIQECEANDSVHWTFAQSSDNSSVLIDGYGQCMEYGGKLVPAQLVPCRFNGPEHFLYNNDTGAISTTNGKFCLQDAQAADDAEVFFTKCVAGLGTQVWQLGH